MSLSIGTAQESSEPRSLRFGTVPAARTAGIAKTFGTMQDLPALARPLLGQKAAVDRERVAGDHRRGGARQVKDRPAISSGVASRLSGVSAAMRSTIPGWSSSGAVKLVRTQVGATALTRIPEGAHSTASALVILTTPPFVA
jgi:hypothetical protein